MTEKFNCIRDIVVVNEVTLLIFVADFLISVYAL